MSDAKYKISKHYSEKCLNRLNELEDVILPKLTLDIESAREQGDLSENFDYHATKDEKAKLEAEKARLKEILGNAEVVPINYFKYKNLTTGDVYEVTLVDSVEADLFTEEAVIPISHASGIAKQIDNHKTGDIIDIYSKEGKKLYQVEILDFKVIE